MHFHSSIDHLFPNLIFLRLGGMSNLEQRRKAAKVFRSLAAERLLLPPALPSLESGVAHEFQTQTALFDGPAGGPQAQFPFSQKQARLLDNAASRWDGRVGRSRLLGEAALGPSG